MISFESVVVSALAAIVQTFDDQAENAPLC